MENSNRGGKRDGSGCKRKTKEQSIFERLNPMTEEFYIGLLRNLQRDQSWAYKLIDSYWFGMPINNVNLNVSGNLSLDSLKDKTDEEWIKLLEANVIG